ncbi:MAG: hypothetical protein KAI43_10450 [Candidatus Aureabacteria bacterium]|nr:hypothetical protein [Candidatus Auribacterota bacterium]
MKQFEKKEEEYMDYKGLCFFLHISYGTARNWKSSGKLTYTTINGKILFSKKVIVKGLRRNTIQSTKAIFEEVVEKI